MGSRRYERDRQARDARRAAGLCGMLGCPNPATPGKATCTPCRETDTRRSRERRAALTLEERQDRAREVTDRRRASGKCTSCGRPRDSSLHLTCLVCRESVRHRRATPDTPRHDYGPTMTRGQGIGIRRFQAWLANHPIRAPMRSRQIERRIEMDPLCSVYRGPPIAPLLGKPGIQVWYQEKKNGEWELVSRHPQ